MQALTTIIEALIIVTWQANKARTMSCHTEWLLHPDLAEMHQIALNIIAEVREMPNVRIIDADKQLLDDYFKSGTKLVKKRRTASKGLPF